MANQIKRPTKSQYRAMDLAEEWLHVDSLAKPYRRTGLYRNNAYARSKAVYRQVRSKWEAFHEGVDYVLGENRKDEARSLSLGRLVLDAASLAQHGFILGDIVRGGNIFTSSEESWHVAQSFKQNVRAGRVPLPPLENLKLPVDRATKEYTGNSFEHPVHTYVAMFAYSALVADRLRDETTKEFVLPVPGESTDEIHRWNYDPQ